MSLLLTLFFAFGSHSALATDSIHLRGQQISLSTNAPVGSTFYVHLAGTLPNQDPQTIVNELTALVLQPLINSNGALSASWVLQADGPGAFILNLIVEPASANDKALLSSYRTSMESSGFQGFPIHFKKVRFLKETATFEAGNYDGTQDDAFVQNYSLDREFFFPNLAGWIAFTNQYGFAMINHDSASFLAYVAEFVNDDVTFQHLRDNVLSADNMAAINPDVSLVLKNGHVVKQDSDISPFLQFRSIRNCYAAEFENGMCYQK